MRRSHLCTRATVLVCGLLAVTVISARASFALINPNFTPAHLVKQSAQVMDLQLTAVKDGKSTATVSKVLKGDFAGKTLTIDFSTCALAEQAQGLQKAIENTTGGLQGALFIGQYVEGGGPAEGGDPDAIEKKGLLFINGVWAVLYEGKDGTWGMDATDSHMLTTWSGGSDMLLRAAALALSDPDAEFPASEGVTWSPPVKIGAPGKHVRQLLPVDLAVNGKYALLVLGDDGDRLIMVGTKPGEITDRTAAAKLTTKSRAGALADLNADGRIDLVLMDSAGVQVLTQAADQSFAAGAIVDKTQLAAPMDLTAVNVGGKPGVAILSTAGVDLWTGAGDLARLAVDTGPWIAMGAPVQILSADFNSDGCPDLLALGVQAGVLFSGKGIGQYAGGVAIAMPAGSHPHAAQLGDFDGDGLFDILVAGEKGETLWQNRGGFQFSNVTDRAGEASTKMLPHGSGCTAGDFNNDGREDILLFYNNSFPQSFFNRGFRSFGFTNSLYIGSTDTLPAAAAGETAGLLWDLTGDGAQDMVLSLNNGELWLFARAEGDLPVLCASGVVPATAAGAVRVTAWREKQCLGARLAVPGCEAAYFGVPTAGPITLRWQLPGQPEQSKDLEVEDRPVRVTLAP